MAVFFIGWQLWQEMTFVLGCCILLVFVFGFVRLWWTNRRIQRLELVDEERRARLAEMRHCGINARSITDIPFGVRAIQSGVEVEGIWISRSNTPESSQVNLSNTLVDPTESSKAKGKSVDRSSEEKRRSYHTSMEIADQTSSSSPQARPAAGARFSTSITPDDLELNNEQYPQHSRYVDSYVPTGLQDPRRSTRNMPPRSSSAISTNRASMASSVVDLATQSRNSYASTQPMLSGRTGPTEAYLDMRANSNGIYDVLPVATWDYDYSSSDAEAPSGRKKSRHSKLQKKSHR